MGKRIISQRRGKGSSTYKANSHKWKIKIKHRKYDNTEKSSKIKGKIIDLINSRGHSSPIAVIKFENGESSYIFAPQGVRVNDFIETGLSANPSKGSTLPLKNIPDGTFVSNIETMPGDGGKLCRASGTSAKVASKLGNSVIIELPSKQKKKLNPYCRATIGIIAGKGRKDKPFLKAGRVYHKKRSKGKLYPRTSAVAMNAVDHPFGSGRGRQHTKIKPAPRFAPPGRKVGPMRPKRTGRKK